MLITLPSYKEIKTAYAIKKKIINSLKLSVLEIFNRKDKKLIVVVGPCSIHSEKDVLDYAEKLSCLQKKLKNILLVMRVFYEKPRTENSWKGFVSDPYMDNSYNLSDGIIKTRELLIKISNLNIPIASEILDPNLVFYFDDIISYGFIGARTVSSQIHRQLASSFNFPVGFKNSLDGDISNLVNALKIASKKQSFVKLEENCLSQSLTKGNKFAHPVLRGTKNFINYDEKSIYELSEILKNENLNKNISIDCSHGNSQYNYKKQIDVINYLLNENIFNKFNIISLMIESFIFEDRQPITKNIKYGISITDGCLGYEDTENMILKIDKNL
ncbi:MAG: 3-deoxy-7-phosphoheptulonate synthase [Chlamydiae bacterium RIFCSPHIGHO2_12_FULL_27_8]|nr:MAG: 3-deoxy-7-phosphoheptulonate synthase [Chlamydiae bacterium RIFCSPHIGHO2_12_FULL_27_8]